MALIAEQPRHGYELIKELEDPHGRRFIGPSPGVIYPTLSLLEEECFIRAVDREAGRKLYEATDEGRAALAANQAGGRRYVFGRMAASRRRRDLHPAPDCPPPWPICAPP